MQALLILSRPFKSIFIDFIVSLLLSIKTKSFIIYNILLVIVIIIIIILTPIKLILYGTFI